MSCPLGYDKAPPSPAGAEAPSPPAEGRKKGFSILGFETESLEDPEKGFTNVRRDPKLCNYTDYIQTNALLQLQEGESHLKPDKKGMMHHEEMLFIVTHQTIELWFKVLLNDLTKVRQLLQRCYQNPTESHADYSVSWKDLALVGHYLRRATMIFHHAADTFAVLQTMHPADFLEFRDYLVPASGFQSFQFRQIEILLGLNEDERVMCNDSHVFNALHESQHQECTELIFKADTLRGTIEDLLLSVNVPEAFMEKFYECTEELHVQRQTGPACHTDAKARELAKEKTEEIRQLVEAPNDNIPRTHPSQKRASRIVKAALYVSSYRAEHPQFAVLSETLDELIALEEGLLLFRARHLHNVERVIGRRIGTGGSSGVAYLEKTRQYRIFTTLWCLRRIFIRSSILPRFSEFHQDSKNINLFSSKPEEQKTK